jgi:hypothetical protein
MNLSPITETSREVCGKHPWSLGDGRAGVVREILENAGIQMLSDISADLGFLVITGEDNCLLLAEDVPRRYGITKVRPISDGEAIRDWS